MELIVADRGPGVPAAHRDEIFQPRPPQLTPPGSAVAGDGLGLESCQSMVLAHGGRTDVTDRAGGGASFSVFSRTSVADNKGNEAMTRQTILVVDDEAPLRKSLSGNLKASGYEIRVAADSTQALKLIEAHPFDLLLLDVNMPGPNGLQVLGAIRRTAEKPILMPSGRSRERDAVEALDLGADDYLGKPFGVAELLARA